MRAWTQLGVVLFARADYGLAQEAFRRALGLAPEDREARRQLSLAKFTTGDRAGAKLELERVLAFYPEDWASKTDLAIHALAEDDLAGALHELDAVIAVHPEEPRPRFYRGVVLHVLGRSEEAIEALEGLSTGEGEFGQRARTYLTSIREG